MRFSALLTALVAQAICGSAEAQIRDALVELQCFDIDKNSPIGCQISSQDTTWTVWPTEKRVIRLNCDGQSEYRARPTTFLYSRTDTPSICKKNKVAFYFRRKDVYAAARILVEQQAPPSAPLLTDKLLQSLDAEQAAAAAHLSFSLRDEAKRAGDKDRAKILDEIGVTVAAEAIPNGTVVFDQAQNRVVLSSGTVDTLKAIQREYHLPSTGSLDNRTLNTLTGRGNR